MKREPKKYDDDDGRVICNMDVEGMRWHDRRARRELFAARGSIRGEQITPSESRLYTWYSVLAGLFIVLVFSLTLVLFVLFCTQIWLR
jgi:hypothetical protein